jgi:hypothetical protein
MHVGRTRISVNDQVSRGCKENDSSVIEDPMLMAEKREIDSFIKINFAARGLNCVNYYNIILKF